MVQSRRKEISASFLELAAAGRVREAYRNYVHPQFRHHNPFFPGDRESLLLGMEGSAGQFPDKALKILRMIEEGDMVAVHSKVRLRPDAGEIALIHIFRFEGDLIIEEWEAGQEIPEDSPNENGAF